MRPGSRSVIEILADWLGLVLREKIYLWIPPLGRAFHVPRGASFAGDFAAKTLEDQTEALALAPEEFAQAQPILTPARRNDEGDTSTYGTGTTRLRSLLFLVDHCIVLGHTMSVLDPTGATVLARAAGPLGPGMIFPAILKRRTAPSGACYTISCGGDFARFFRDDVLPLLHFLRTHGPEIGPLHIITRPDFPAFIGETLAALCAAYPSLDITELRGDERLENVTALWLSRTPDASDWDGATRAEADELGAILRAYYKLPPPPPPEQLLFVSRGRSKLGALLNEAEVLTSLMDYGFEFFSPRSDDLKEQIEAFQSARVIVAPHGEALANLVFCQPGTLVIELFPSNLVRSVYCWLALRLGLRYCAAMGYQADAMQAFVVKKREVIAAVEAELGPLPEEEEEEEEEEGEEEEASEVDEKAENTPLHPARDQDPNKS